MNLQASVVENKSATIDAIVSKLSEMKAESLQIMVVTQIHGMIFSLVQFT